MQISIKLPMKIQSKFNRIFNEIPILEINNGNIVKIGNPLEIPMEINWKERWNFNEIPIENSMKYQWKSIGNPVEI